jgi:hypothetical protein
MNITDIKVATEATKFTLFLKVNNIDGGIE